MSTTNKLPPYFLKIYNTEQKQRMDCATPTVKLRYEIIEEFINKNKYTTIAEIGCGMGYPAVYILENCPSIKEYIAIDPGPPHKNMGEKFEKEAFAQFESGKFLNTTSQQAVKMYPDEYFDFIYMDHLFHMSNETCILVADIESWIPKMKSGGILCGHDSNYKHVREALNKVFGVTLQEIEERQNYIWWVKL